MKKGSLKSYVPYKKFMQWIWSGDKTPALAYGINMDSRKEILDLFDNNFYLGT